MVIGRAGRGWRTAALFALLSGLLFGLLTGLFTGLFTGPAAAVPAARAATGPAVSLAAGARHVVLIGVPGLLWSDVSEPNTPALWALTGRGSAASLSVRTTDAITCPVDGWLTISAGQRARLAHGNCALPPAPTVSGAGGRGASVPGWAAIKKDNSHTSYAAELGLLGTAVRRGGTDQACTMAVGPGGVFAAADGSGRVDRYFPSIAATSPADWSHCAFTAVDVDVLFRLFVSAGVDAQGSQVAISLRQRAAAAAEADRAIAQVLGSVPQGTEVVVAGLSDSTSVPHLHVALDTTPAGFLAANSTRRTGLVTLTDVTASVLRQLGLDQPARAVGSPWRTEPSAASVTTKVRELDDQDVAAQAIRRLGGVFFIVLFAAQLLLYGVATVTLRRRSPGRGGAGMLSAVRILGLAAAAAPVATLLANLVPWWRSGHPGPALLGCVLAAMAAVTALSLAGPWRRSVTGPCLIVAASTAVVLGADVLTGSDLQFNGFVGYSALVAGRFYGFGNMSFAVFATGSILTAAWLAEWPLSRIGRWSGAAGASRTRIAAALTMIIGLAAVALDGAPAWGADFGGVPAIVVATAVLATMISGNQVSVVKLGLYCLTGLVIVLAFAFADALRPVSQQTHLGRFWEQLQSGEAIGVIARKFVAMLASLGYWPFTVVTVGALGMLYVVLARPAPVAPALLERAQAHSPTLRPALMAMLTLVALSMVMNDSGVVIPALAFSLAVPLILAASVRARELDDAAADTAQQPAPEEPRSACTA